jgi:hypothetical protein
MAALVMAVGGVFLFRGVRPLDDSTLATSANRAVERAAEAARQPTDAGASASSPSTSALPGDRRPERIVAMVLLPPTRSVAPVPTLTVPADADRVRFELQLESNDFPRYRVELKNPATRRVHWRSDWILPSSAADQTSVAVLVPANLLGPQHYSLDLTGRDRGGREEVIGTYTVRIERP